MGITRYGCQRSRYKKQHSTPPHERKYVWLVTPFGLWNAPAIFIVMMHDLQELWRDISEKRGVPYTDNTRTTLIVDNNFIFAINIDKMFIQFESVCIIARRYNLT